MKTTAHDPQDLDPALAEKLHLIREDYRLPLKRIFRLWLPCLFAAFITALTLAPTFLKIGDPLPSGLITLICFLPMVFYFSAQATFNELSALEARIRELEKKESEQASPANHRPSGTSGMASANSAARAEAMPEASRDS